MQDKHLFEPKPVYQRELSPGELSVRRFTKYKPLSPKDRAIRDAVLKLEPKQTRNPID